MVYDEGLNRVDGVSGQTATSFAECATSSDYAKAEGKLPMLIGKGQNGVVMADLTALLHVLALYMRRWCRWLTKCRLRN